jgi:hypothetical protein
MIRAAPNRITFAQKLVTTGKTQSGATFTSKVVSKDTGGFGTIAGTVTELGSTGIYFVDLTPAESDARHIFCRFVSSDANTMDTEKEFIMEAGMNSGVAQSATGTTIRLAATASSVNSFYNDATVEIVRGTGAGQCRTITAYVGSNTTATVDRAWITNPDNTSVYLVHPRRDGVFTLADGHADANASAIAGSANAATMLKNLYNQGLIPSSVDTSTVTPTTTQFAGQATLSVVDNFYNNCCIVMTSGTLEGIARRVTGYVGATFRFNFSEAWPGVVANADTFVILGHIQ